MIELLLLRHAKSSWTDPSLDDEARPLNKRGKEAAKAMGREIAARGLVPELVICSPATRARDTWKIVSEQLEAPPRAVFDEAIYDFGNGGRLLSAVKAHGRNAKSVMVIGHNPSVERLAQRLINAGDPKLRDRLSHKYPTAALAVIRLDASSWSDIAEASGKLVHFIRPKDVKAGA